MSSTIAAARPDSEIAIALIAELEAHLSAHYPAESRHGYSIENLLRSGVAFFVAHHDAQPAGCGGIQLYGTDYGELKRMYVRPAFRGLGVGKAMVQHLSKYAFDQGVTRLRLETGVHQVAAIALYERLGFVRIPPFGEYRDDPLSRCYEKLIGTGAKL